MECDTSTGGPSLAQPKSLPSISDSGPRCCLRRDETDRARVVSCAPGRPFMLQYWIYRAFSNELLDEGICNYFVIWNIKKNVMQMFPKSCWVYVFHCALNVGQTGDSSGQAAMPNCAEGIWIQFGRVNNALPRVFSLLQCTWMNPRLLTLSLSKVIIFR